MKVTDIISNSKQPFISFEILPPLKGKSIDSVYQILDPLMEFKPPFINVTYHRSEYIYKKMANGSYQKVVTRKRPGTVAICASIMNRYKVEAVPHLTCGGFTIEETEDALIDLQYIGVTNILAIRGDAVKSEASFIPEPGGHAYTVDLVRQMKRMNEGVYLEEDLVNAVKTDFCIGVGGYPEKHFEAPNFNTDLKHLKEKVDAGADYIVTQMFFDNQKFYDFVNACRAIGITVPIVPGLKPLTRKKQLTVLPRVFAVDIPEELERAVTKAKTEDEAERAGIEWAIQQSKDLVKNGVPCLHYYTMGQVQTITEIGRQVF
ncbi:MAG: methylenetetrahydrofolate reductase [NAD(P)H] [Chitinophagales bacterium]|nr:methylenetetrahydrofolate reductase [NAD(P)H] [Chitinophagales bacterium]